MNNIEERKKAIGAAQQVIVKAGTRLLISRESIATLIQNIAELRNSGRKVLLVSSGAVGMGMETLGVNERPKRLSEVQALAAIGQSKLMQIYSEVSEKYHFPVAQLLLTAADLRNRNRFLNVMNCINALWATDVLPIVNENDPVSVDELKFGDNDTLAGALSALTGAGLTLILTTVDGLRDRDDEGKLAERISLVQTLNAGIKALAGGTDDAKFSIGGMASKLRAAELAIAGGGYLWIADGRDPKIMGKVLAGADVGTLFAPSGKRLPGYKRWLSFFSRSTGTIIVDDGASNALKNGKSLLPSGMVGIKGEFKRGDTVDVVDCAHKLLARGLSNYSSNEAARLCGANSEKLRELLGVAADEELIHRDHMCLIQ